MSENYQEKATIIAALEWHLLHGADEMFLDTPQDRTKLPEIPKPTGELVATPKASEPPKLPNTANNKVLNFQDSTPQEDMMGAAQAIEEAKKLVQQCESLDDLKNTIMEFNGLSVKKTASNMVFADGNPKAKVMLIGEAPGADEDIQGKPFVGMSGQLLDKILACIDLDRNADAPEKSVYISNIMNWRPPGNRTPTASEMNISLPFIQKHIELIQPETLIFCSGVAAKILLQSNDTISKLRGKFHDYKISDDKIIPAMVTYHPAYLMRTPAQKKAVWADMLMFQEKLKNL